MTSTQQRAALQRQIWQIANDVRGAVDGWDFKQYVLGTLFYRFISENFALYIEAGDDGVDYASLSDGAINPAIKDDAIKTKGYFIYPSQLFANVVKNAYSNESLNTDLAKIFLEIEKSAIGYDSENDKVVISAPDFIAHSGILRKHTFDTIDVVRESVKSLYQAEKQAEDEAKATTEKGRKQKTF